MTDGQWLYILAMEDIEAAKKSATQNPTGRTKYQIKKKD
jgi:hypothetical protein